MRVLRAPTQASVAQAAGWEGQREGMEHVRPDLRWDLDFVHRVQALLEQVVGAFRLGCRKALRQRARCRVLVVHLTCSAAVPLRPRQVARVPPVEHSLVLVLVLVER